MKVKEFLQSIDGLPSDSKPEILKEAIRAGLFNEKKSGTKVALVEDMEKRDAEIKDLKKTVKEYQIMFDQIQPEADYMNVYKKLSDKGLASVHQTVKDAFALIKSGGFEVVDFEPVRELYNLGVGQNESKL